MLCGSCEEKVSLDVPSICSFCSLYSCIYILLLGSESSRLTPAVLSPVQQRTALRCLKHLHNTVYIYSHWEKVPAQPFHLQFPTALIQLPPAALLEGLCPVLIRRGSTTG
ncbi:hypothetical protein AMEX_G20757 [Astyanax mexicanus]|uniref:Uncharacterized protein n=1 Tax=Astyanax mexicanus TaxID=7994 RepID=A0A8T2L895_ASTMX|nr:hypothetical protein AMEX_G20757 [Astyanax mexicanus]